MEEKRERDSVPPDPGGARDDKSVSAASEGSAAKPTGGPYPTRYETLVVTWEGPLPPPALLEQYDEVVPGLAKQIADQARIEAEHVRDMDKAALNAGIADRIRRQLIACAVVLTIVAVSAFALTMNAFWVAGIALSIVTGAAAVFMSGILRGKDKTEK